MGSPSFSAKSVAQVKKKSVKKIDVGDFLEWGASFRATDFAEKERVLVVYSQSRNA